MTEQILRPLFDWRSAVASPVGPPASTTRLVLLTLSLHMSAKGDSCFPSIDLLSEESALSRKAVITHLAEAEKAGWISKAERPQRNGQGWRRMEYFASIPAGLETRVKADEGGERPSPPSSRKQKKVVNVRAEGGERQGGKVVNVVHPSTSVNSSRGTPKGRNKQPRLLATPFTPPPWIDLEVWKGFEAMRKKVKKPMTDRARKMILNTLQDLKTQGHDPNASLAQSELNSWADVYAPKDKMAPAGKNGKKDMPWWMSDPTIIAKGEERGIRARPGESIHELKGRIQADISGESA